MLGTLCDLLKRCQTFSKFLKVHTFGSIVSLKLSLRKETVFNSMKTLKDTAKLL